MNGKVKLSETFVSLQGESTYAGLTCYFIRLAGCNLRCRYCDTRESWDGGREVEIESLVRDAVAAETSLIEITGGEPLLQPGFVLLASALVARAKAPVLVETNGSLDISVIPDGVVAIVDIKTPGSGEVASTDMENIKRLRPYDELKFVILDRNDYEWARGVLRDHGGHIGGSGKVLFSPVHGGVAAGELAQWILDDKLNVRLQIQLHRVLGLA